MYQCPRCSGSIYDEERKCPTCNYKISDEQYEQIYMENLKAPKKTPIKEKLLRSLKRLCIAVVFIGIIVGTSMLLSNGSLYKGSKTNDYRKNQSVINHSKNEFVSYLNEKYSKDYHLQDFIFEEDTITEIVQVSKNHDWSMQNTTQLAGYYVKDSKSENYIGYIAFQYEFVKDIGFYYKTCYFYDNFQTDEIREATKSYINEQLLRLSVRDKFIYTSVNLYDEFEKDTFFFSTKYNGDIEDFLRSELEICKNLPSQSTHIVPKNTYLAYGCFYMVDDVNDLTSQIILENKDCEMFVDLIYQSIGTFGYVYSPESYELMMNSDDDQLFMADYMIYLDDSFVNSLFGIGGSSSKIVYSNPLFWIHPGE